MLDQVTNFLFSDPWGQFILTGLGTSGFVSHAIAITPTKKDDNALGIIRGLLNVIGGNYLNAKNKDK